MNDAHTAFNGKAGPENPELRVVTVVEKESPLFEKVLELFHRQYPQYGDPNDVTLYDDLKEDFVDDSQGDLLAVLDKAGNVLGMAALYVNPVEEGKVTTASVTYTAFKDGADPGAFDFLLEATRTSLSDRKADAVFMEIPFAEPTTEEEKRTLMIASVLGARRFPIRNYKQPVGEDPVDAGQIENLHPYLITLRDMDDAERTKIAIGAIREWFKQSDGELELKENRDNLAAILRQLRQPSLAWEPIELPASMSGPGVSFAGTSAAASSAGSAGSLSSRVEAYLKDLKAASGNSDAFMQDLRGDVSQMRYMEHLGGSWDFSDQKKWITFRSSLGEIHTARHATRTDVTYSLAPRQKFQPFMAASVARMALQTEGAAAQPLTLTGNAYERSLMFLAFEEINKERQVMGKPLLNVSKPADFDATAETAWNTDPRDPEIHAQRLRGLNAGAAQSPGLGGGGAPSSGPEGGQTQNQSPPPPEKGGRLRGIQSIFNNLRKKIPDYFSVHRDGLDDLLKKTKQPAEKPLAPKGP